MLRKFMRGKKKIGLLKVAPRVSGKIIELDNGCRMMIVEQKGFDIYRGRCKSVDEAIQLGEAALGLDQTLHMAAKRYNVSVLMIAIPELFKIFIAPITDFENPEIVRSRAGWNGRAIRMISINRFHQKYMFPDLKRNKKRGKTT